MNYAITMEETPLEPERLIIDPHLHLWKVVGPFLPPPLPSQFLLPEVLDTIQSSGHAITHTVFVECHAMYRPSGDLELRAVGETEFINGIAQTSTNEACRVAHRIVGNANLSLGGDVERVLDAHLAVAGDRFRGVRVVAAYSSAGLFGNACAPHLRGLMLDSRFREGVKVLAQKNLSLDIWCLHSQLDELINLADALPDLTIILNHLGTPEHEGAFAGEDKSIRAIWSKKIRELALRKNVLVKLGGLGMDMSPQRDKRINPLSSQALAERWRPYIEAGIEAFGPKRCMFESNYPSDCAAGSYGAVWNAFKIIVKDLPEYEKDQLFRKTAATTYRINID